MTNFEAALRASTGEAVIDLERAQFIEAYALVGIACVALRNVIAGRPITFIPPHDQGTRNYLARMHLPEFLEGRCGVACGLPAVREAGRQDVLVELQWFHSADNLDPLVDLLFTRLDGKVNAQILAELIESFWEIGDNIRYHAEAGGGVVAAQVYARGRPFERVTLAVGDVGRGIRTSLRASGLHNPVDDSEAITLALRHYVSSIDDPGRGVGLPTTAETVRGLGGKMTVRSGRALRVLYPVAEPATKRTVNLRGTVVGMSIPCR